MKEIVITQEDLTELSVEHNFGSSLVTMDASAKKVYDYMHTRKLVTSNVIESKLGIKRRTASEVLGRLLRGGYVERKHATLKTSDGANHMCFVYWLKEKENGRKRNSKKV